MKINKLNFIIFLLFYSCNLNYDSKWEYYFINNSLEGWHIFQDDGEKSGWEVKDNILTEDDFNNNIECVTGATENGSAITTTTCPHSEITWTALKTEMDKL